MILLAESTANPTYTFGTLAGIVAISFILTEFLKYFITPSTPIIGKVPVTTIPILICIGLTVLANKVMRTDDGKPYLSGNVWTLIVNVVVAASSSSGLYSWVRTGKRSVGDSESLVSNGDFHDMKPLP